MTRYHCTVEYRDESGCIRHHVTDLEAKSGDEAAEIAEEEMRRQNASSTSAMRVEEVVCWRADH